MKNKKGAKAQKFIKSVQSQGTNKDSKQKEIEKQRKLQEKAEKEQRDKELRSIFKPTQAMQQKVPLGVDPKSVVCDMFKLGTCTKGNKCTFSHDLETDRRTAKINFYADPREEELRKKKEEDSMENWDQQKLEQVVNERHKNQKSTSNKTCKYFLQAIIEKKYGWFWKCPNSDTCVYRHAIPEGFVLKRDVLGKKEEDLDPIEDILEMERRKLPSTGGTPVTEDTFKEWKARKLREKQEADKKAAVEREKEISSGKAKMSGRELFSYRPDLFVRVDEEVDSENVIDLSQFKRDEEDEENVQEKESKFEEPDTPAEGQTSVFVEDESLFVDEDIPDDELD
eukprot:TRINITY_DN2756_c0_g1_i1.p1 TRINITY_DN2756_c0_g1~~TRINITY_DN2756_c0_g1_i1.p1  ORF type:complete len:339 (-),score=118.06 TRINITY_DN2756_c0_g1_i1:124-1140(-)